MVKITKNENDIVSKREKLKKDYLKAGFDLNKIVDFWGKKMKLVDAIVKMDKDDISDGYKQINWDAYVKAHPEFARSE